MERNTLNFLTCACDKHWKPALCRMTTCSLRSAQDKKQFFRCAVKSSQHLYILSWATMWGSAVQETFFHKEQASAMITWIFLFFGLLTRNVCWNVCNKLHAAHFQNTWRLSEAKFIIINRNNIKLFHFMISGHREIVFILLIFDAFVWILPQFGQMDTVTWQHFQDSTLLSR